MAEHSFKTLMRRLTKAGFKQQFIFTALLPEWWEESYSEELLSCRKLRFASLAFWIVPSRKLGMRKNHLGRHHTILPNLGEYVTLVMIV